MERFKSLRSGLIGIISSVSMIAGVQIYVWLDGVPNGGWIKGILSIFFALYCTVIHRFTDYIISLSPKLRKLFFGPYFPEGTWLELVYTIDLGNSGRPSVTKPSLAIIDVEWVDDRLAVLGKDYGLSVAEPQLSFENEVGSFRNGRMRMVGEWTSGQVGTSTTFSEKAFTKRAGGPRHYTGYFFNAFHPEFNKRLVAGYRLDPANPFHRALMDAHHEGKLLEVISANGGPVATLTKAFPEIKSFLPPETPSPLRR